MIATVDVARVKAALGATSAAIAASHFFGEATTTIENTGLCAALAAHHPIERRDVPLVKFGRRHVLPFAAAAAMGFAQQGAYATEVTASSVTKMDAFQLMSCPSFSSKLSISPWKGAASTASELCFS